MTLATNALPYGLRDVKLFPIDPDDGTVGNGVDLPASQKLTFGEAEEFETLRGDDKVIAVRGKGPQVEWSLESGGISLAAYTVLAGGTLGTTGSTPNQVQTFNKKVTDVRPYFRAEGQALSDSGGDFHGILYKARASDKLEGTMEDGKFWISSASGMAIGDADDNLYDFVQNETTTAIDTTP
jgi:hypothetical protein